MEITAVLAAFFGGLIGAQLVQIARSQDHQSRLRRFAIVLTGFAILTDLVTNGGGHSRTAHHIVFAVVITLLASAVPFGVLGRRAVRERAETPRS